VKALKQGVDDYVLKRKGYKSLAATVKNVLNLADTRAGRIPRCLLWCPDGERQLFREGIRNAHARSYIVPCSSANEYERALETGQQGLYDAVIVAQHPAISHLVHVVRQTAQQMPMLPVLLIADDSLIAEYYISGAWAVLPRPFNTTTLTAWLRRAFHISALRRQVIRQNEALERYARRFEADTPKSNDQ
jgi:DNA-binding NarL/FixJ family response regulator